MTDSINEPQSYNIRVRVNTTAPYKLAQDVKNKRWKYSELLELGYAYKIHGDNVLKELQENNEKLSAKIQLIAGREFSKEQQIYELKKALENLKAGDQK